MAKKNSAAAVVAQSEVNRSEAIRKYKADHPNAGPPRSPRRWLVKVSMFPRRSYPRC